MLNRVSLFIRYLKSKTIMFSIELLIKISISLYIRLFTEQVHLSYGGNIVWPKV